MPDRVYIDALCFRHDVRMSDPHHDAPAADPERLGQYVVSRRIELGYRDRIEFAGAAKITTRVMSDIENGKRTNFDKGTIAKLEKALGWATGSAARILRGGEPRLRVDGPAAQDQALADLLTIYRPTEDPAIVRVMRSNLPDVTKQQIVRMLITEQERAQRERSERVEQLLHIFAEMDPSSSSPR
jgi:hypothetical protein